MKVSLKIEGESTEVNINELLKIDSDEPYAYRIVLKNKGTDNVVTQRADTGIGMLKFKKSIFDNAPDIVKTSEVFGWGKSAPHEILLRNSMYRFIVENHLDRGLIFEPIILV